MADREVPPWGWQLALALALLSTAMGCSSPEEDTESGPAPSASSPSMSTLASAQPSPLVLDSVYDCGTDGKEARARHYYRFFASGEVVHVTAIGGSPDRVAKWLVATPDKPTSSNPDAPYLVGEYTVTGSLLTGLLNSEEGGALNIRGEITKEGLLEMQTQGSDGTGFTRSCRPS